MGSPEKILAAAAAEFAEKGYHGVRMEHVADRAKLNKSLVYRHFGDRDGLFAAVLRDQIARRTGFVGALPEDLGEALLAWARRQAKDAAFNRLVGEEGLRHTGGVPVEADLRRDYYAFQVDDLRSRQAAGRVRADLPPEPLFFALLVLTVGPVLLPQIFDLVLGEDGEASWEDFLTRFAGCLAPGSEGPGGA